MIGMSKSAQPPDVDNCFSVSKWLSVKPAFQYRIQDDENIFDGEVLLSLTDGGSLSSCSSVQSESFLQSSYQFSVQAPRPYDPESLSDCVEAIQSLTSFVVAYTLEQEPRKLRNTLEFVLTKHCHWTIKRPSENKRRRPLYVSPGALDGIMVVSPRRNDNNVSVWIDCDFQSKFYVGRPTSTYNEIFESIPKVFVGSYVQLQDEVNRLTEAMSKSFSANGLSIPPWRTSKAYNALFKFCDGDIYVENEHNYEDMEDIQKNVINHLDELPWLSSIIQLVDTEITEEIEFDKIILNEMEQEIDETLNSGLSEAVIDCAPFLGTAVGLKRVERVEAQLNILGFPLLKS